MGEELKLTLELLRDSMKQNQEMIASLREENRELKEELRALKAKIEEKTQKGLQKEVMRTFKRKQKDIIKSKIMEIANSRDIRIAELKAIIVDDHEYCSKATFYRYIQELIGSGMIQQAGDIIITQ